MRRPLCISQSKKPAVKAVKPKSKPAKKVVVADKPKPRIHVVVHKPKPPITSKAKKRVSPPKNSTSNGVGIIERGGKKYDKATKLRLTDCCGAWSTYQDEEKVCKVCYHVVSDGEGDGLEDCRKPSFAEPAPEPATI